MTCNSLTVRRFAGQAVVCFLMLALAACATTNGEPPEPDPWENFNRPVHEFNMTADRYVLRPVARGYDRVTPGPAQSGVRNFFRNLGEPLTAVNGMLQGEVVDSGRSTVRFVINTTVGVLGLFDVAGEIGLERNRRDFGQTLGKWGVASGPYVVLPFLGPSTVRDGSGRGVDWYIDPYNYFVARNLDDVALRNQMLVLDVVQSRAALLAADRMLEQAFDPYTFLRDSYLQQRRAMIRNGDAEDEEDIFREDFDDLDDLDDYDDF